MIEFNKFGKIPRYSRECFITEKIDGTNASIYIGEDEEFLVGSRKRWITPENDNYGFARWAYENKDELMKLGYGHHFGEWWGHGIQRGYGKQKGEKIFSLFNTSIWIDDEIRPACCSVVPLLWHGIDMDWGVRWAMQFLRDCGSEAVKGFMRPEGIIIYHTAGNLYFKKTLLNDDKPKGLVK